MEYQPKVGLVLQTDVPDEWISEFEDTLLVSRNEIEIRKIYSGPMAGVALYLPQAIMVFVASAYFTGLVAAAGKDHYEAIKKANLKLWSRVKKIRVTASGSKAKTSDFDRFQMAFSINGQTSDGKIFKLVLQLDTSDEIAKKGIENFLELIRSLSEGSISNVDLQLLKSYRNIGGTTVVTIDPATGKIIPADDK